MPIPLESKPPSYIFENWQRLIIWIESYQEEAMAQGMIRIGTYDYITQPKDFGTGVSYEHVQFKPE